MSQSLHGRTLTEEVFNSTFRLNLKHLDRNNSLPPQPLINNPISTLRDLILKDQLIKINLHITVEHPRLDSQLI